MKLETLISHAGELLAVTFKSHKSTDSLVSEYLHQKKYIGSKERKFITDIVFSSIRNLSVSAYCLESALSNFISSDYNEDGDRFNPKIDYFTNKKTFSFSHSIVESNKIDYELLDKNWFKLVIAATSTLIHENFLGPSGKSTLNLLNMLYKNSINFKDEIIFSIGLLADINYNQAINIYNGICSSFSNLKNVSVTLSERNYKNLNKEEKLFLAIYSCLPSWIIDNLIQKYDNIKFVLKLSNTLKEQAPTSIRVNQFQNNKAMTAEHLISLGIGVRESQISPAALILEKRVQLNVNQLFRQGFFEVQDEGSQLISFALAPEPQANVLDACAGAGGKTLHIADIQNDKGKILASDTDFLRLKELRKRAKKHKYQSIETYFAKNGTLPDNFKGSFDYVLIDAPCSGIGTIRRLPLTKWRLTPDQLEKHSKKQLKLLNYYSEFVKPGGIVVYSTCSFLSQENDEVVSNFLKYHPDFTPDSLSEPFSKFGVNLKSAPLDTYKITLIPSIYNCDGFFMARLKRIY